MECWPPHWSCEISRCGGLPLRRSLHRDSSPSRSWRGGELNKDRGIPLKNKEDSEREENLHEWVVKIVDNYLEERRDEITDNGRRPLLTTHKGRPLCTTLRRHLRAITRPCFYQSSCPVESRDKETCWATEWSNPFDCPDFVKPHSFRRGAITVWLNECPSKELVSDRMDVSTDALDEHYD